MVIKIKKKHKGKEKVFYKSSKNILTPLDIKKADKFDLELSKTITCLEKILLKSGILSKEKGKKNVLRVWYEIGKALNNFLVKFPLKKEDKDLFWNNLYGYSPLIHKGVPSTRISQTRNDFRMASLLATHPWKIVERVGPWAMWREILSYKNIMEDSRILKWVIKELIKNPRTRNGARPFLKGIAKRFKRIDTRVLDNKDLLTKLNKIITE
ncbi:MAG: hypothetical protein KJ757_07150 [Planctomycetes bacterium]|nr:hypothetical protein [Planctomycetota bacterium]